MKRKLLLLFTLSISLFLTFSCSMSDPEPVDTRELVEAVYQKSGLEKQVPEIQKQADGALRAYDGRLPENVLTRFREELNKVFHAGKMERRIKRHLKSDLSAETLEHMLEWYDSSLGEQIALLEAASSTSKAAQEQAAFVKENQGKPIPEERRVLLERMDDAILGTETLTDLTIYLSLTFLDTLNDLNPNGTALTKEQMSGFVNTQREKVRPGLHDHLLWSYHFSYRSLDIDDLEEYVEFLELPLSRAFNDALRKALIRSIYIKTDLSYI